MYIQELSLSDTEKSYQKFIEHFDSTERFSLPYEKEKNNYDLWLNKTIGLKQGHNSERYYWLKEEMNVIGLGRITPNASKEYAKSWGHIGYYIAVSYRKKGYGTIALDHLLHEIKKFQENEILLRIKVTNIASRKITESNGGLLKKVIDDICIYQIK